MRPESDVVAGRQTLASMRWNDLGPALARVLDGVGRALTGRVRRIG